MNNIANVFKSGFLRATAIGASTIILFGCGGSSGSSEINGRGPIPSIENTASVGKIDPIAVFGNVDLYGDKNLEQGGSYGFALTTNNGSEITAVNWQQLSGPPLTILAHNSQTIGFDALEAGNYSLQADVTTTSSTKKITYDFAVQASSASQANVRLDHTVTERAKVSLRVDSFTKPIDTAQVNWKQTAGPAVLDFEEQGNKLFFNAPAVNRDQVIQIEASVTFSDGTTNIDTSIITINNTVIDESAYFPGNNIIASEEVFAVNNDSPFKTAIESCIYTNTLSDSCTFGKLPLIGQRTLTPTVDDILDRTLVSHEWMGQRFKQYLEQSAAGPDMLKLLRGTTAIVISYDVRPSFYWTVTGAIYLDARNFWLTPEERDTLNEVPDYRSGFSGDLNFRVFWRYVKNNQAYMPGRNFSTAARETRSFDVLEADISWLMYHELGHANDFFPSDVWPKLSSSNNPLSFFRNNGTNSDLMIDRFPLNSAQMKALAQVSFAGVAADAVQKTYVAQDIEGFFTPDIASSYYSYLNEREDFATLFERFMMQYRLGASADIGIINIKNNDNYLVTWGQRDRFNTPDIQARTHFTVTNILPELGNINELQQALPSPILLKSNVGWFDNIDLSEQGNSRATNISPYRLPNFVVYDEGDIHAGRPTVSNKN